MIKKVKSALISVYNKDGLEPVIRYLAQQGVQIYSTGGTLEFIEKLGVKAQSVESLTGYPSILGGRVKTLHPKVFGGILARRNNADDTAQLQQYEIPEIDLVIVDLYPFEETVSAGASEAEIIEKIDIGGISLIRAAGKNFADVAVLASRTRYTELLDMLQANGCGTTLDNRQYLAMRAFEVSCNYDSEIYFHLYRGEDDPLKGEVKKKEDDVTIQLRYGENPHQKATYIGQFPHQVAQLSGKELSYNNLYDIDAALALIAEFREPTFAVIKHTNACGVATRPTLLEAWTDALASDPVSAYGGVLACNREVDKATAEEVNKLFFEVLVAPAFNDEALAILKHKKNRIILHAHSYEQAKEGMRWVLNGITIHDFDMETEVATDLKTVTTASPTEAQVEDLLFANKIVKHSKSNAIVLAKNGQLLGSGVGQTSRVDALKQAIDKARSFNFDLQGAVMASDAFFPFADCVEIAHKAGITAVIQPGGSVRDQDSVDYCNANGVAMVTTGIRHFRH